MNKVKHQFTLQSTYACLSTGKAIVYNQCMNKKDPNQSLISRLTELNGKGFSKTEMAKVANVSKQAVTGWFRTGKISKESAWQSLMQQVFQYHGYSVKMLVRKTDLSQMNSVYWSSIANCLKKNNRTSYGSCRCV